MRIAGMIAGLAVAMIAASASAAPPPHPKAEAEALDLAKKAIALRSVQGPGNKTPEVAALYKAALVAGGFKPSDITITPVDDTAYLIARWPGTDPTLKPLVISGHMDVVEAKPADWKRDPFTPVVEGGYLFGRGATDMKLDGTIAIAALGELRREGFTPRRDIVIEFSGDEETNMKTSGIIADKARQRRSGAQPRWRRRRARRKDRPAGIFHLAGRGEDLCRFQALRHQSRRPFLGAAQGQRHHPAGRGAGAHRGLPLHARAQPAHPRLFHASREIRGPRDRRRHARLRRQSRPTRPRSPPWPPIPPWSARSAPPASPP